MMRKLYTCMSVTAFMLLMSASVLMAQERVVSGTVTDENGVTMPGVNVLVKGTSVGTASDVDGNFKISIPNDQALLLFTFVGYATSEIIVGSKTTVNVQLTPDVQTLSELVVTGYQVQRKADISGAVAVINSDDLQNVVASSFAQKLQGRAAGVTVSSSGAPGDVANIRIRGISSFGNNEPLYVIDGVQASDKSVVLNINPNDIETMQILKDPSTASIYGSKATNGVVVITTKKGKSGGTKLTYSGSVSFATAVKGWDDILITNSGEYLDMTKQFFGNGGQALPKYAEGETLPEYIYVNSTFIDGTNTVGDNIIGGEETYNRYTNPIMRSSSGTNWWKESTRVGKVYDHNISLSGGVDAANFFISAGLFKQEGVLEFNDFERYNIRANSNFKVGQKVRVGQTLNYTYRNQVNNPAQSEQGVISQIYKIAPIIPVYDIGTSVDDEGERDSFGGSKTANTGNANNPYAALFRGRRNPNVNNSVMGNLYAEADLINGLTFRSDFKYNLGHWNGKAFTYRSPENQENQGAQNFSEYWGNSHDLIWTNTLNYTKKIADKHNIVALAGFEGRKGGWRTINGNVNNYFTVLPNAWYLSTTFGQPDTRGVSSNGDITRKLSYFGKIDYSMSDKYYLTALLRRDGSSKFSKSSQWGTFPALSAAWRITGESFASNISFLNDFKLRYSWGITGNDEIPGGNFYSKWGGSVGSANYAIDGSNSSAAAGYHLTAIGTDELGQATKWEEAITSNVGFDATLFNDKLTVVLDVYKRVTDGLLYNAALPGSLGNAGPNAPARNIAGMTNKGFDLALGYKGEIGSDLKFSVDVNVSRYKNEIDKIDGAATFFYPNSTQGRIDNRLPEEININQIGSPISSFRGYELDGMIETAADVAMQSGSQIGGLKFKDRNGDGVVNDDDLTIIGSPHPDFTYGINLGLNYKNFDFTMFFVGSQGNEIFNYTKLFTHFRQFFSNVSREYYQDNGKGGEPLLNILDTSSKHSSEYYVENGSYLRLGQIQLAYNVPLSGNLKNYVNRVRVYVQGQNLFTITKYSGLDPALSNSNIGDGRNLNDIWTGYDIGQYPSNKLVTFGVTAEF